MELFTLFLIAVFVANIEATALTLRPTLAILYPKTGNVQMDPRETDNVIARAIKDAEALMTTDSRKVMIRREVVDDSCDGTQAFKSLYDNYIKHTNEKNDIVGMDYIDAVIGVSCNQFYGSIFVPMISIGCNAFKLNITNDNPWFARVVPALRDRYIQLILTLIKQYKWPRVTIIQAIDPDWDDFGHALHSEISKSCDKDNSDCVQTPYTISNDKFDDESGDPAKVKERINTITDRVFNDILKSNLTGPRQLKPERVFILLMYDSEVILTMLAADAATSPRDDKPAEPYVVNDQYTVFLTVGFNRDTTGMTYFPRLGQADVIKGLQKKILSINVDTPITKPGETLVYGEPASLPHKVSAYAWMLYDAILLWAHSYNLALKMMVTEKSLQPEQIVPFRLMRQKMFGVFRNAGNLSLHDGERTWAMNEGEAVRVLGVERINKNVMYQTVHRYDTNNELTGTVDDQFKYSSWPDQPSEQSTNTDYRLYAYPLAGVLVVALVSLLLAVRRAVRRGKEKEQQSMLAKLIKWENVVTLNEQEKSKLLTPIIASILRRELERVSFSAGKEKDNTSYSHVAFYEGIVVTIEKLKVKFIRADNPVLLQELKEIATIKHENLNIFVGIVCESPHLCQLTAYAKYGTLHDVLVKGIPVKDNETELSLEFKISFALDIAKGMEYLHNSVIMSHGRLSSYSIVVDKKWRCLLNHYGVATINTPDTKNKTMRQIAIDSLWLAPELLAMKEKYRPRSGTQPADVYAYGIVLQEIITCDDPFCYQTQNLDPEEIVQSLISWEHTITRPIVKNKDCPKEWHSLMHICWSEEVEQRPAFVKILGRLWRLADGKTINIIDNMLKRLKQHTQKMEEDVEEKNRTLTAEKKTLEKLLYNILPVSIAEEMLRNAHVVPEAFESVSIFFSDIVGFLKISEQSTPYQQIHLLKELYKLFDSITDTFNVYKCETVSDVYMVAAGLPKRTDDHAAELTTMALHLLSAVSQFRIPHMPNKVLQLRIGINSVLRSLGGVVAGVIGKTMPNYRLFGDTVNTAARMQTSGLALRIHVSQSTAEILLETREFELESRGEREVKGKGHMTTYFVTGKKGFNKPMPDLRFAATLEEHDFK